MLKQNRNALTNLTNRYRAVLRRCRLRALALALACALTAPPLPAGADSGGMGNGDTYIGNGDGAGNNGGVFIDTNMWKFVYGGYAPGGGTATKNTVTINAGGSARYVYGGYAASGGNATNNTVTINDGAEVLSMVSGGYAGDSGTATHNTVSISGAPTLSSCSISGGFSHNGDAVTGNLLELRTSNLTVKCIQNFAAYAFVLPATIQSGDVLLTATDAIDLTNSGQISSPDFQRIDVTGDTPLSVGDTVTLLQSDAGLTAGELRESVSGSHGVTLSYTFKLTADGNAVVATVMGDEDLPPDG